MNTTPDTVKTDIHQFLHDLAGGSVAHDMATELEKVVKAVTETAKSGKLTLTIHIGPLKGQVRQLAVEGVVKSTIPRPSETSVFFPTKENTLTRKNPDQIEFADREPTFNNK